MTTKDKKAAAVVIAVAAILAVLTALWIVHVAAPAVQGGIVVGGL